MRLPRPDLTTFALFLVALLLTAISWHLGGIDLVAQGLLSSGRTLLDVGLLLVFAFLIAGLTQALISRELVESWLGRKAGWRGILIASLAGALIPGGPYVYYPIAGALFKTGAGIGVLVAFISAKNLWSVSRLPMEFALLGPQIALARFLLTLVVPPLAGFAAHALFGRLSERLRAALP